MQIFADKIFEKPIKIIQAFDNETFKEAFSQIEDLRKRPNTYLLGYIRYEAKEIFLGKQIKTELPLLYFEVFCHCEERSDEAIREKKSFGLPRRTFIAPRNDARLDYTDYEKAINKIKEEIACGNTYQVNYTYDYKVESNLDGLELYHCILKNQKTPYNAYIKNDYEEILSFSPELFFELDGNKIKTKPMKGTVKRGKTQDEDQKNIEFLKNDIKNRAENVMIVDLLRNDLGKIAKTGTVKVDKLFEIETHKTLHQMTSEVSAELEDATTLYEIFNALFPCGSVTGAPKINTMEIIDKLEVGKRNVYCGAIGLISPEKTVFSVPIRILQRTLSHLCKEGQSPDAAIFPTNYICRVGGAIVWDSTPEEEWEETLTKIKFLSNDVEAVGRAYLPDGIQLVETILVENGKMKYEKEHFDRMKISAKELGFKTNFTALTIQPFDLSTAQQSYILRLLLNKDGSFETQKLPLEPIETNKITISKTPIDSKNPLLHHKTTCRSWYDEAMKKIKSGLIFDEIFFNEKGELTEGARSNIVLQIHGELFTPPVECGLLNGVLRQKLLKNCPPPQHSPSRGAGIPFEYIKEKILYLEDLKKAEKIFCINSIREIVEVTIPPTLEGEVCFHCEQELANFGKQGGGPI